MNIVKSFNKDNSVKVIAFALNFSKRLSVQEIEMLVETLHNNLYFTDEFTSIEKQQEISMTITPDGTPKPSQGVGGVVSMKKDANQNITWTLEINKDFLLITNRAYTRWENISRKAYSHIEEIVKIINDSENRVENLTLEYLDEFEILDKEKNWKEALFKKDCKYITSNIYELDDYWHITNGYFKTISTGNKMLDTVGINYFADEKDNLKEKINIRMQHKVLLDKSETIDIWKEIFNNVHNHSKEIFEEIVLNDILDTFNRGEQ